MSPLNVSLSDLIARLDAEHADASNLDRVSEAGIRAQTLSDLGDQLVDHYIGEARQVGASWSEIGDAIGVSKQAAQQRRGPTAFARFTDLNRHSIVLAQEAARTHKHPIIGTEHMLLGLLGEPRGLAHELVAARAGSEQQAREAIENAMPPTGDKALRGHIAFAPESKAAIEQAQEAATELGHDWVGTEHTLLGLIRVEESHAAQILRGFGFTADELHETVKTEIAARFPAPDQP